jgi:flagellar motility protein MotE (MotC chaperone)
MLSVLLLLQCQQQAPEHPRVCSLLLDCCAELQVRQEQEEAERVAAVVGAEEAEVAAKAAECQALKDDAAAELVRTHTAIHTFLLL